MITMIESDQSQPEVRITSRLIDSLYTEAMLTAATRKRLHSPSSLLFDELLAEIRAYSAEGLFDDDVCIVGLDYTGRPPARPERSGAACPEANPG